MGSDFAPPAGSTTSPPAQATRARVAGRLAAALRERVGGADEPDPERFLEGVAAAKLARSG